MNRARVIMNDSLKLLRDKAAEFPVSICGEFMTHQISGPVYACVVAVACFSRDPAEDK
ncbi:hypothetical protein D3C78_1672570 [compost metagenome]